MLLDFKNASLKKKKVYWRLLKIYRRYGSEDETNFVHSIWGGRDLRWSNEQHYLPILNEAQIFYKQIKNFWVDFVVIFT